MAGLDYYLELLADTRRIEAFLRAIRSVVRPGDHVLDVGTGLGTFARAAAQAGARRVTAIESSPVAAAYARELGLERDFGGRVRLVEADAERVTLDEPADVVIYEDYGRFVWHPALRPVLAAVRSRLARPGARFLPGHIELVATPVDRPLPAGFLEGAASFPEGAREILRKRHANLPRTDGLAPRDLLGAAARLGEFRPEQEVDPRISYRSSVRAGRSSGATGLGAWMRLGLAEGVQIDNDPALQPTAWKQLVLPFETPLAVEEGEELDVTVDISHGPGPMSQLWRWSLRGRAGTVEGSTANALPGDLDYLRRGSPDFVPAGSPWHQAASEVCGAVNSTRSVREIAGLVYTSHQDLFKDEQAATDWVFDLLTRLRGVTTA